MKKLALGIFLGGICCLLPAILSAQVIVNDSWADGGRDNGADPLDADWWSSTSTGNNSVEVGTGFLGLVTGTSGRGLHGTFAPQTLGIGDTLTATFTFMTPATVGSESGGGGFRFAIADFNNAGLAADLQSGSSFVQPLFTNLPAYMMDFDVNRPGIADDTSFRKHINPNATGRLMGTTTEWTQLGTSTDVDYAFTPNTEYVAVIALTRTGADSMDILGSLSQNNVVLTSHSLSDASGIANNFGLVGVWANSALFGSSATIGQADNGVDFTNIKIELTPAPEPSAIALLMLGTVGLLLRRRRLA
jgi:hypothetical protein